MFWFQFLLFLALLPIAELTVIVRVGGWIGTWPTLGLLLAVGIAGVLITKKQGSVVLRRVFKDLQLGQLPTASLLEGVLVCLGGILLVMPGFVSDVVGALFLIPWTRKYSVQVIQGVIQRQMQKAKFQVNFGRVDEFGQVNWHYTKESDPLLKNPALLPEAQVIPVDFSSKRRPDSPNP